ncbi:hypothetical protein [Glycomyces buryatensis]|uniref:Uncharacterized protein n=1 Tax=Glycomyces buryatensis TaxID=2570927 RepID=A0A4S8QSI2_9ACTN|nr:hypothetical protein [Glycomyces buryatensis]THV43594.1 hypothetical protein FAB82_00620 [Glycomyces buryatensis]
MPDPTPEQPPSWPPASEPTATPTNPPRITTRGVGHVPPPPQEDAQPPEGVPPQADPYQQAPPASAGYGDPGAGSGIADAFGKRRAEPEVPRQSDWGGSDLGASFPPRSTEPEAPQPTGWGAEPEPPRQSEWLTEPPVKSEWADSDLGGPVSYPAGPPTAETQRPDFSDQWPPRENSEWISQQSAQADSGWGISNGGAAWRDSGVPADLEPERPADQSYSPDPNAVPYGSDPQAYGNPQPDAYGAPQADGFGAPPADAYGAPQADAFGAPQPDAFAPETGQGGAFGSQPYQPEPARNEGFGHEGFQAEAPQANPYAPEQQPYQGGMSQDEQYFADLRAPGAAQSDPYQREEQPFGGADAYAPEHQPPAPESAYPSAPGVPEQRQADTAPPHEAAPAEPAPPQPEERRTVTAPPTHRGVRYAIYGIGGLITLGLIIGIVLMLGSGAPPDEPGDQGGDGDSGGANPGAGDELTPERYTELAGSVGTAEWFEWRYGTAGENGASEELAQAGGDAIASEPLLGDTDRSIQGQLAYASDDADLSGVDHVTTVEATDSQLGLTPRAGGRFSEEGHPELELQDGSTADCIAELGTDLGKPVALARPEQSAEVNAHSVIAFSSGIIATTGISGAQGGTCLQLPDGHVPTDVALTDGNELALVTTWQPESQTGSLVVVALSDQAGKYQSSWSEPYAGLPNTGAFGAAETVGVVELPFTAPTSVDAWSNSSGSLSLSRATIEDGAHADTVATSGYALVGSLAEGQVTRIDLASTLAGLAAQHYEGAEFAFDAAAGDPVDLEGGIADVAATEDVLAVATGDGVVHELDSELAEQSATEVGANPTCLVVGAQSGEFIATSRGDAKVSWVSGGEVTRELADQRLTDPLCASETPALEAKGYSGSATMLLVADFGGQALHSYLVGAGQTAGGAGIGEDGAISYAGAYEVEGNPFGTSVTVDLPQ